MGDLAKLGRLEGEICRRESPSLGLRKGFLVFHGSANRGVVVDLPELGLAGGRLP